MSRVRMSHSMRVDAEILAELSNQPAPRDSAASILGKKSVVLHPDEP
jgi:hypothetical protein